MKERYLVGLATGLMVFGLASGASASLTKVGTAWYDSNGDGNKEGYNLIYDADSPLGPITWLDYSTGETGWVGQNDWASGLNVAGVLTYSLNSGLTASWTGGWRLPSAGMNPQAGYNQTTSEMGHLYYTEMGFSGGSGHSSSTLNSGVFDNLHSDYFWSGTQYSSSQAWFFGFNIGDQGVGLMGNNHALAVRPGEVSTVPVPGAVWLLGSGLAGLASSRIKRKKL